MKIRLKYRKENGRLFPIIDVILRSGKWTTPPVEALVDSGASRCSFDVSLAKILRLSLDKEKTREILTAAGPAVETFYTHRVNVNFAEKPLPVDIMIEIDFVSRLYLRGHPRISLEQAPFGILGHHNFFEIWKVTFDTRQGEIELETY